jgi:hypothetical protein
MAWLRLILAACTLAGTTPVQAADRSTAPGKLIVVARQRSRGIKLAYRAVGHGVERAEGQASTRLEVRSANDPVPAALAVATGVSDGAGARGTLLGDGLAAAPPDVRASAALAAAISTTACARGAARDECRCTTFTACTRRVVGGGGEAKEGTKLVCRGGERDSACPPRRGPCSGTGGCVLDARRDDDGLVACAGDSNTAETKKMTGWCRYLGEWLDGFQTRTIAWPGTRASDDPAVDGLVVSSHVFLKKMLAWPKRADVVILAWGTNDVPVHTAQEIADAIDVLVRWMREAGVVPLVATVPWWFGDFPAHNAKIDVLNGLLVARHGPCLVDFTTITPPTATWYTNWRHLNSAAQERRAIAAYYALETLPRSCVAGVASPAAGKVPPGRPLASARRAG